MIRYRKLIFNNYHKALFAFYIIFVFTNRVFEYTSFTNVISYIIIAGCGNLIFFSRFDKNKINKIQLIVLLILFAGVLTKVLVLGDLTNGKTLFLITSNLGLALILTEEIKFKKVIYAVLSSIYIYYTYFMISGQNVKLIQEHFSKNHINVNVIFIASLLLIIINKEKKKPYINILIASLTFMISVWSRGRGGIISSGILLILIVIDAFKYLSLKYKIFIYTFILIGFYYIATNLGIFELYFDVFYRKEFITDVRFSILSSYLNDLNFSSFIMGTDLSSYYGEFMVENIHNSYLSILANFGIYGAILIIIYLVTLIKIYKKDRILFTVLCTILFRAWSDTILIYYFDFIIYYIMIQAFKKNSNYMNELE